MIKYRFHGIGEITPKFVVYLLSIMDFSVNVSGNYSDSIDFYDNDNSKFNINVRKYMSKNIMTRTVGVLI